MDLLLDIGTHDLAVPSSGAVRLTSGLSETARQRIKIKLQTFLGEWFLDTTVGFPYFRDVLVKNPNLSLIRVLFRRLLLDDQDVVDVPRLDLDFDSPSRHLEVNFDAVLSDGTILSLSLPEGSESTDIPLGDLLVDDSGDYVLDDSGDYVEDA